jgi:hypothetical protein
MVLLRARLERPHHRLRRLRQPRALPWQISDGRSIGLVRTYPRPLRLGFTGLHKLSSKKLTDVESLECGGPRIDWEHQVRVLAHVIARGDAIKGRPTTQHYCHLTNYADTHKLFLGDTWLS